MSNILIIKLGSLGDIAPGPASLTSLIKIFISEALYKKEFFFAVIPIRVILFLLA